MKKLLVKWFMPKPADIARIAAKSAADFVNSVGKEEAIAQFVEKTEGIRKAQSLVTKWLADGKIDQAEVEELQEALTPLAQTIYDRVVGSTGGGL